MKYPAQLKGIVSIVAATQFDEKSKEEIYARQLIYADMILLNHIDRVPKEKTEDLRTKAIPDLNPTANVRLTEYCSIEELDDILLLDAFDMKKYEGLSQFAGSEEFKLQHDTMHQTIQSYFFIERTKTFDKSDMERRIGYILWEKPEGMKVLRVKGLLSIAGCEGPSSLQA
jgi:G3E family GTPase